MTAEVHKQYHDDTQYEDVKAPAQGPNSGDDAPEGSSDVSSS
jgi:hypothetical protein